MHFLDYNLRLEIGVKKLSSIIGNLTGLKPSQIKKIENISRRRVPSDVIISIELTKTISQLSREIRRQIGVLINRSGVIEYVIVGDAHKILLPDFGRLREGHTKFRGLRLIHTHLQGEPITRDDLVDLSRLRLDLIASIDVNPEGLHRTIQFAYLIPPNKEEKLWQISNPISIYSLDINFQQMIEEIENDFFKNIQMKKVVKPDSRAILVLIGLKGKRLTVEPEESINELTELCRTAGLEVVDKVIQFRDKIDPKYLVGKGKLEDIISKCIQLDVQIIIFDQNITPGQAKSISEVTDLKVIDRTQLILDIFARRAKSRDGKLQVQLAQLKYRLPRLGSKDDSLSRLTGGIGGRKGPGETKLAEEKSIAKKTIAKLEKQLKAIAKQRKVRRSLRNKREIPVVSIIGYTNAGKSTLLNTLTNSSVLVEDKLFATLDPMSRRFRLSMGKEIILTDTVGFIRELPDDLISAFKATLEELGDSSLLLHLVDISNPYYQEHINAVENILVELNLHTISRILILNKKDLVEPVMVKKIEKKLNAISISANSKQTHTQLLNAIKKKLS